VRRRRHLVIAAVAAVAAAVTARHRRGRGGAVRAQPGDLAVPSRAARRLRGDPRGRPAQYLGAVVKRVHEGPGTRRQGGVSSARGFPPRGTACTKRPAMCFDLATPSTCSWASGTGSRGRRVHGRRAGRSATWWTGTSGWSSSTGRSRFAFRGPARASERHRASREKGRPDDRNHRYPRPAAQPLRRFVWTGGRASLPASSPASPAGSSSPASPSSMDHAGSPLAPPKSARRTSWKSSNGVNGIPRSRR
jgi:hypothetical protein